MFGKKYDTATTDEMPVPKPLTAGCGRVASVEEVKALAERFGEKPVNTVEDAYISGFLCGMQFFNASADSEVYGMDALGFENNAFAWYIKERMKDELRKVGKIISGIVGDDDDE